MDTNLWNKILAFDFDSPPSEYGFSIRIANEQFWTRSFTQDAILEYKKFMYLATISDMMVSPSEVIDSVWHQHLIFTQSYREFCELLGKHIQHVPSTHNREDFQKFRQAKERTTALYEQEFGKQPEAIWRFDNMFGSLHLEKAKFKIRSFLVVGILSLILLTVPAYFLLSPLYVHINNPYFIIALLAVSLCTFFFLDYYNSQAFRNIVSRFDQSSFVFNLHPMELVYLRSQKLENVINGVLNDLILNDTIRVHPYGTLELVKNDNTINQEQLQISSALSNMGQTSYAKLLASLIAKPIFLNIPNSMEAFKKYFNKSKKFTRLFQLNFLVWAIIFLITFTRIVTGVLRDRPVGQIVLVTLLLAVAMGVSLHQLTKRIAVKTIPDLYKEELLPAVPREKDLHWNYFLLGNGALTASFAAVISTAQQRNYFSSDDSYPSASGCGSSGGSSCGSCGGCGGD